MVRLSGRHTAEVPVFAVLNTVNNDNNSELKAEGESHCTMELEPSGPAVRLSITHTIEREPSNFIVAVSGAWPKVISNLKSLLETSSAVLQDTYPIESANSGKE